MHDVRRLTPQRPRGEGTRPADAEAAAWAAFTTWNDAIGAAGGAPEGEDGLLPGQAELRAEDVALATADRGCRDRNDYEVGVARARDDLQREYVDAHRDELDAWVKRFAQG